MLAKVETSQHTFALTLQLLTYFCRREYSSSENKPAELSSYSKFCETMVKEEQWIKIWNS